MLKITKAIATRMRHPKLTEFIFLNRRSFGHSHLIKTNGNVPTAMTSLIFVIVVSIFHPTKYRTKPDMAFLSLILRKQQQQQIKEAMKRIANSFI